MPLNPVESIKDPEDEEIRAMLADAAEMGFRTLIVFGYKDGVIHTMSSPSADRMRVIGALEAAKHHLWEEGT